MSTRSGKRSQPDPTDEGRSVVTKRPRHSGAQSVQDTPTPALPVLRQRNKASGAAKQTVASTSIAQSRPKRNTVLAQEQASENHSLRLENEAREKENRQLRRQLKKSQPREPPLHEPRGDADGQYESEEGSDDDSVIFSSSIAPMTGIAISSRNGNQMDPKLIRRVAGVSRKSANPPRNAFMTPMASRPPTSTNSTGSQGSPPPPNNKQVQQETPSANDAQPQSRPEGLTAAEVNTGMRLPAFTDAFIKGGLSGRPATAHYAAPDCRIIHAAAKAFEARVIAVKAFPSATEIIVWADECWSEACRAAAAVIKLTDRVRYLIKSKTSHVRFEVLDIARAIVPPVYGFKADGKKASLKHNERLYDFIKTKFAFKDPKLSQGFMEHEVFVLLFRGWAFAKEHKPGALYEPLFNPVSIYTLAFLKLIVKYVLDEWSTGRYVQGPGLKAKTYSSQYERHLQDVADWAETVPTVTRTIRAKMFRSAREPFVTADSEPTGLDAAAVASITAELSRRTGDTDDEAADDDDDSMSDQDDHSGFGAQTAGVHGKGLEGTGTDLEGGHAIDDNGSGIVTDDSRNGGDNGNDNNDGNGNNDGGNGGGDDDGMVGDDSGNGDDDEDKIEVGEGVGEGEGIGECVITHWLRCTDTEGRTRHWPQCIDEDGVLKRLPRARDEAGKKCILDGQFIYVAMDADGNEFYVNEDGRKVLEW